MRIPVLDLVQHTSFVRGARSAEQPNNLLNYSQYAGTYLDAYTLIGRFLDVIYLWCWHPDTNLGIEIDLVVVVEREPVLRR